MKSYTSILEILMSHSAPGEERSAPTGANRNGEQKSGKEGKEGAPAWGEGIH